MKTRFGGSKSLPEKFRSPPDPLQEEKGRKQLEPRGDWKEKKVIEYLEKKMNDLGIQPDSQDERKKQVFQKLIWQMEGEKWPDEFDKKAKREYIIEFVNWILGKSKYNLDLKTTPWGKARLVGKGISEYVEELVGKKTNYELAVQKLRCFIPDDIDTAWLYFKFIVTKMPKLNTDTQLANNGRLDPDAYDWEFYPELDWWLKTQQGWKPVDQGQDPKMDQLPPRFKPQNLVGFQENQYLNRVGNVWSPGEDNFDRQGTVYLDKKAEEDPSPYEDSAPRGDRGPQPTADTPNTSSVFPPPDQTDQIITPDDITEDQSSSSSSSGSSFSSSSSSSFNSKPPPPGPSHLDTHRASHRLNQPAIHDVSHHDYQLSHHDPNKAILAEQMNRHRQEIELWKQHSQELQKTLRVQQQMMTQMPGEMQQYIKNFGDAMGAQHRSILEQQNAAMTIAYERSLAGASAQSEEYRQAYDRLMRLVMDHLPPQPMDVDQTPANQIDNSPAPLTIEDQPASPTPNPRILQLEAPREILQIEGIPETAIVPYQKNLMSEMRERQIRGLSGDVLQRATEEDKEIKLLESKLGGPGEDAALDRIFWLNVKFFVENFEQLSGSGAKEGGRELALAGKQALNEIELRTQVLGRLQDTLDNYRLAEKTMEKQLESVKEKGMVYAAAQEGLDEMKKKNSELEKSVKEAKKLVQDAQNDKKSVELQLVATAQKAKELGEKAEKLAGEIGRLEREKTRGAEVDQKLKKVQDELKKTEIQKKKLEADSLSEKAELVKKIKDLEDNSERSLVLYNQETQLALKASGMEKSLEESRQKILALEMEKDSAESGKQIVVAQNQQLQNEIESLRSELEKAESDKRQEIEKRLAELQKQLTDDNEMQQALTKKWNEDRAALRNAAIQEKLRATKIEEDLAVLRIQKEDIAKKKAQAEEELKRKDETLLKLQKDLEDLAREGSTDTGSLRVKLYETEAMIKTLGDQLTTKESKLMSMEDKLKETAKRENDLKISMENFTKALYTLRTRAGRLTEAMDVPRIEWMQPTEAGGIEEIFGKTEEERSPGEKAIVEVWETLQDLQQSVNKGDVGKAASALVVAEKMTDEASSMLINRGTLEEQVKNFSFQKPLALPAAESSSQELIHKRKEAIAQVDAIVNYVNNPKNTKITRNTIDHWKAELTRLAPLVEQMLADESLGKTKETTIKEKATGNLIDRLQNDNSFVSRAKNSTDPGGFLALEWEGLVKAEITKAKEIDQPIQKKRKK